MKSIFVFFLVAMPFSNLFGWGKEHDIQAELAMKYVGDDIANFFLDAKETPVKWCHFPNGHKSISSKLWEKNKLNI